MPPAVMLWRVFHIRINKKETVVMEKDKKFDFWQDHSLEYLEMAFKKDFQERVENPDGYGKRTGQCGDTIEFFLMQKNGMLNSISYDINGCKNTNACANTVIHLARGKKLEDAWKITYDDVLDYLKTVPENEHHCAELAIGAFYLALTDLSVKCEQGFGLCDG